jgi:hemerythrin-like domain-containing protein
MMPVGPLMIEHRLIERMVCLLDREARKILETGLPDLEFLASAVEFARTYADRCHHGKEEDILFRELLKKSLKPEHRQTIEQLIAGHVLARRTVDRLAQARERFLQRETAARDEILDCLQILVKFYPPHIETEDRHFFLPVMSYFTPEEQAGLLAQGMEFDRKLMHERYQAIVASWETTRR